MQQSAQLGLQVPEAVAKGQTLSEATQSRPLTLRIIDARVNYHLDQNDIIKLTTLFGHVLSAYVSPDRYFAEICFANLDDAHTFQRELNGLVINGVGTVSAQMAPNVGSLHALSPSDPTEPQARNRDADEHTKTNFRHCRFELINLFGCQPEEYEPNNPKKFHVVSKILGPNNENINYILEKSKTSESSEPIVTIQIDGVPRDDAPVNERLHVAVSGLETPEYKAAVKNIEQLLGGVCQQFVDFCRKNGHLMPPNVSYRKHSYRQKGPNQPLRYVRSVGPIPTWLGETPPIGGDGPPVERERPPPGSMYGNTDQNDLRGRCYNLASLVPSARDSQDSRTRSAMPLYVNNRPNPQADKNDGPTDSTFVDSDRNMHAHFNGKEGRDRSDGRRPLRGNSCSSRGGLFRDRDRPTDSTSRDGQPR